VSAQPATADAPTPRDVTLPVTNIVHRFYTRENLTLLYKCSHGELGRLLVRKQAPQPIRLDGVILWYADEALDQMAQVLRTLERWRKH
jgi:hypothetical protein